MRTFAVEDKAGIRMPSNVASARGLRRVGGHDLGGHGDGMQVVRHGDALYVGHTGTTGAGTSILDVADPRSPRLVTQWPAPPNSHSHKAQVADGLLLVNHEKFPYRQPPKGPISAGVAIYRLDDPLKPEQIAFWPSTGLGVHRIVWTGGRYAHFSATPAGFRDRIWIVLDLADPARPVEAARWWWPGQAEDETPEWPAGERWAAHHALICGDRAYLGFDWREILEKLGIQGYPTNLVRITIEVVHHHHKRPRLRWPIRVAKPFDIAIELFHGSRQRRSRMHSWVTWIIHHLRALPGTPATRVCGD